MKMKIFDFIMNILWSILIGVIWTAYFCLPGQIPLITVIFPTIYWILRTGMFIFEMIAENK